MQRRHPCIPGPKAAAPAAAAGPQGQRCPRQRRYPKALPGPAIANQLAVESAPHAWSSSRGDQLAAEISHPRGQTGAGRRPQCQQAARPATAPNGADQADRAMAHRGLGVAAVAADGLVVHTTKSHRRPPSRKPAGSNAHFRRRPGWDR